MTKSPIKNFMDLELMMKEIIYMKIQTASKTNFIFHIFKKDVLNKYYNNPIEYEIDGFFIK